jgi:hypothetical protein
MKRRDFVTAMAAGVAATGIVEAQAPTPVKRKNRIKQGCMRTNFPNTMAFDDMCPHRGRAGHPRLRYDRTQ